MTISCPPVGTFSLTLLILCAFAQPQSHELELSRTPRPWEFFCATGMRAGLFGTVAKTLGSITC